MMSPTSTSAAVMSSMRSQPGCVRYPRFAVEQRIQFASHTPLGEVFQGFATDTMRTMMMLWVIPDEHRRHDGHDRQDVVSRRSPEIVGAICIRFDTGAMAIAKTLNNSQQFYRSHEPEDHAEHNRRHVIDTMR
jgi:hypothetical protein